MTPDAAAQLKSTLDEAFAAFEAGDDATARKLCRDALAMDPESSSAHSLMGLLYERQGRLTDATEEFETVLAANPRSRAERSTLRRLRAEEDTDAEVEPEVDETEPVADRRWLNYVVPAVAAVLVLMATLFIVNRLRHPQNQVADASSVDADLAIAREAYNRGDMQTAADHASRVLRVQPDHAEARTIYDQAMAMLSGAQQPRVGGQANGFAQGYQTPPNVQQEPAWPAQQQPAQPGAGGTGRTNGAAGFGTIQTPGNQAPRSNAPTYSLPPVQLPPLGGYTPGQPYFNGRSQPTRPMDRRVAGGNPLAGQIPRSAPPARPSQVPSNVLDPPSSDQAPAIAPPGPHPDSDGGRISITVDPPAPRQGSQAAPEVAPNLGGGSPALEPPPGANQPPVDPAVAAFQRRQEEARAARERQRAAERRRAENR